MLKLWFRRGVLVFRGQLIYLQSVLPDGGCVKEGCLWATCADDQPADRGEGRSYDINTWSVKTVESIISHPTIPAHTELRRARLLPTIRYVYRINWLPLQNCIYIIHTNPPYNQHDYQHIVLLTPIPPLDVTETKLWMNEPTFKWVSTGSLLHLHITTLLCFSHSWWTPLLLPSLLEPTQHQLCWPLCSLDYGGLHWSTFNRHVTQYTE